MSVWMFDGEATLCQEVWTLGWTTVRLADERTTSLRRAGSLIITVCGRKMATDCLVGPSGCEPLLGQLVMEGLDIILDPRRRTLAVRPESPDRPTLKMKRANSSEVATHG